MFGSHKIFSGIAAIAAFGSMGLSSGHITERAIPEVQTVIATQHASTVQQHAQQTRPMTGRYTVKSGDSLSSISRTSYGKTTCWPGIWSANTTRIADPDLIYPGEGLKIPTGCSTQEPAGAVGTDPAPVQSATQPTGQGDDDNRAIQHVTQVPVQVPPSGGNFYAGVLSYGQLEALWVAGGGPAWAEGHAAEIAECESGGNRYAYNPSGATGLWQILGQVTDFGRALTDPWVNVHNAVAKFRASGDSFAQWVCQ